ncbi:imidazole glycerol phosphate synthase subunit HisF [Pseudomonas gingeri]|uniref:imidazole glycerol phosphate synthase subunit HisF n=1 Tax=Pseudomonas gingeri TaxID=117681 RepID=UPI0015A1A67F|nr:imidazole glycerol phosphate synthase cyclase subunit [Pseudomonas gingeri]NWA06303.1 imidazole glycerol phosphate synthase subunit HisF [Pseudomonas gingeri]
MLKVRVIPTLLWKGLGLVKGAGFDSWRRVGPVLPAIKVYNARDVDELILVDITATQEGELPDHDSVNDYSEECAVPLTVGGGITSVEQVLALLHSGADKIAINSAAYVNPGLIEAAAARFGAQCVVASIDARRMDDGSYRCFSHAGTRDTGREVEEWARELAARGAGEILLTSIDRDGTMEGYDLPLVERIARAVDIPLIASGGAGSYQHMIDAVQQAGASAVAAASIFHFTELTPAGAKSAMQAAGIPVRRNFVGEARS